MSTLREQLADAAYVPSHDPDIDGIVRVARARRRRTVAASVAAAIVLAAIIGIISRSTSAHRVATTPATSDEGRTVTVTTPSGVTVRFTTSRTSPMIERFRKRQRQLIEDERRFHQPLPPDYCWPDEYFEAKLSINSQHYDNWGVINRGSSDPVRVPGYGSNTRFVYVLVKSFRPSIRALFIRLSHPAASGPMTALGDGWFVFAAPIGTPAPWYTQGTLFEASSFDAVQIATIPETRSGAC